MCHFLYTFGKILYNFSVVGLRVLWDEEINRFTGSYFSKMIDYCVDARWGRV